MTAHIDPRPPHRLSSKANAPDNAAPHQCEILGDPKPPGPVSRFPRLVRQRVPSGSLRVMGMAEGEGSPRRQWSGRHGRDLEHGDHWSTLIPKVRCPAASGQTNADDVGHKSQTGAHTRKGRVENCPKGAPLYRETLYRGTRKTNRASGMPLHYAHTRSVATVWHGG